MLSANIRKTFHFTHFLSGTISVPPFFIPPFSYPPFFIPPAPFKRGGLPHHPAHPLPTRLTPPSDSPFPAQLSPSHPAHPPPPDSSPPTKLPMTTTLQQQPTTTHPHQPAHNNQYYAAHNPRPRPPLFRGAGGMNTNTGVEGMNTHRSRGYDNNLPASHNNQPTTANITQLTTRSRALPSSEGLGV